MSRTDKDTPYWVLEKTSPKRREYHDHTRANNHGVFAANNEHFCSINEDHPHGKAHHMLDRRVWTKDRTRFEQHVASGACKKNYTAPFTCNHDIFDRSINNHYGCNKPASWKKVQERWDMDADYSWREVLEWIELNGIVSSHTMDKTFYVPNAPCKCDAWTFYDDCSFEVDVNTMDHGTQDTVVGSVKIALTDTRWPNSTVVPCVKSCTTPVSLTGAASWTPENKDMM